MRKQVLVNILFCGVVVAFFTMVQLAGATNGGKVKGAGKLAVKGRVMSPYGPVADARVRVAGDKGFTLTDRQGRFTLAVSSLPSRGLWITAGKEGWFSNGAVASPVGKTGDISLYPITLGDRPDYRFVSPVTCSRCHIKVSQYWDKSKMAHTTANPRVLRSEEHTSELQSH